MKDDKERIKEIDSAVPPDHLKGHRETVHFGYQEVPRREKINKVKNHFDSVAAKYDFMNTLLSLGIHHLWKHKAIKMLKLKRGDRVLDLCGGTGDLSILSAGEIGPSGRVVLYDINRPMMELGRNKVSKTLYTNQILFVQGDAEMISLPDQFFDAAIVGFGIRNLTNMKKGFEEMYRILKPGGKLMCLEFSRPASAFFRLLYDFYSFHLMPLLGGIIAGSRRAYTYLPESIRMFPSPGELTDILQKIGFSKVNYRRLTNGIAVVHLGIKK